MTKYKIDWSKYPPIPGFDCVKLKNEIQAKIYEETKNMTRAEIREYYRKGSERFQKKMEEYRRRQREETESDK